MCFQVFSILMIATTCEFFPSFSFLTYSAPLFGPCRLNATLLFLLGWMGSVLSLNAMKQGLEEGRRRGGKMVRNLTMKLSALLSWDQLLGCALAPRRSKDETIRQSWTLSYSPLSSSSPWQGGNRMKAKVAQEARNEGFGATVEAGWLHLQLDGVDHWVNPTVWIPSRPRQCVCWKPQPFA